MPRFYTNSPSPGGADPCVCPEPDLPLSPPQAEKGRFRVCPTARSTKAFSLLEIVSVIAIIGILGGTIAPLAFQLFTSKRGEVTVDRLEEFKKAIIGNPFVIGDDVRTSFGYVGDMGNLPASLQDLYIRGVQPTYSYNSTLKTGAGWRGPYINPDVIEDLATLRLDAYMQQFVYSTTAFTDTQTNASAIGSLTSTGPNRTQGGAVADDRKVYIFQSEARATVSGFVKDTQGNRLGGVSVTINYPSNGTLTTCTWPTQSDGYFVFPNALCPNTYIPYGNRSITIEPKLVYAPGSYQVGDFYGKKTGPPSNPVPPEDPPDGIPDDVIIYVTNRSPNDITIRGIRVYFDVNARGGQPNYDELFVAGPIDVYAAKETGGGQSGSAAKFTGGSPPLILGNIGGASAQNHVVRVQSPQTHLPDLRIVDFAAGETARIALTDFKSGGK
ncbi:MAG: hypothetical protein QMD05_09710, partial [Candidatus Brocadiaceae bacterium]|nr:hypothetical protein [Candidatus Brocadiaceae bacterium]